MTRPATPPNGHLSNGHPPHGHPPHGHPPAARSRRAGVRLRLALWHAALLGALALALAAGGVWLVEQTLRDQVDEELVETARLLAAGGAPAAGMLPAGVLPAGVSGARGDPVRELRAGRLDVLVFDPAARRVVSVTRPRRHGGLSHAAGDRGAAAAPPAAAAPAVPAPWPALLGAALARGGRVGLVRFSVRDTEDGERRAVALPVPAGATAGAGAGELVLVAARDLRDVDDVVARLWRALALALPAALLVSLGFGYVLARRSLAPVLAMSAQAARLGAAAPAALGAERLPAGDPRDELGRLAAVINALLDRMGAALEQQRQFMADASHELRTPAAVVRSAADVALRRDDRTAPEYRQALEIARDEADRLARVVDDLFLLARADAGQPTLRAADFYLDEALAECARAMRAVAESRGVTLDAALGDGAGGDGAPMCGDEALVRRLVLNLLDNALKYTPRGGRVTLRLAPDELAADPAARAAHAHGPARVRPAWRIEVEDTGPGVPVEARPRIFDRFFRSEAHAVRGAAARSGAGLGLAMARTIAEAHGGRLELSRSDASGSLFVAVLPRDGS